jgi:hypothetical protein
MKEFITQYENIWGNNPARLLEKYNYHPSLTEKLDAINVEEFSRENLYEIVLWKVSRYPYIENSLLEQLKDVANIERGNHRTAEETLDRLLRSSGIRLAMASTILRFLNPNAFQIIDDRAYRVLFPKAKKFPDKPAKVTDSYVKKSISVYWQYLDELNRITGPELPFEKADRILYQLDIELGNKIGE